MTQDPLDTMIGTAETGADREAALRYLSDGDRLREVGDREGAIAQYRQAASADPLNYDGLFKLAYELDLVGEEEEAIALYEQVAKSGRAPVNSLMNLAVLYEDRGEYVSAEKCLRQVLDTDPNHLRARLFMKDVHASKEMLIDEEQTRDLAKRSALLDTPVTDFELSVRARNCLKKMNIRTLGDLLRITEAELMGYKNFGEASLSEIKQMLATKGLRLGQGLEDQHKRMRKQVFDSLKGTAAEAQLANAVSELGLSVRARKALQLLGIQTIGDLVARTEAELMGVKNFGATSLDEVRLKLGERGLELRRLDF